MHKAPPQNSDNAITTATADYRFKECEVCAQVFDTTDVEQIFHHGPEAHEPLIAVAA